MAQPVTLPTTPVPAMPQTVAKAPATEATSANAGGGSSEGEGFQAELIAAGELLEQSSAPADSPAAVPDLELEAEATALARADLETPFEDLRLPDLGALTAQLEAETAEAEGSAATPTRSGVTPLSELALQSGTASAQADSTGTLQAAGLPGETTPTAPAPELEQAPDLEAFRPLRPAPSEARQVDLEAQAVRTEDTTRGEGQGSSSEGTGEGNGRGDASADAPFRLPPTREPLEQPLTQKFEAIAQAEATARSAGPQPGDGRILPEIPVRNEAEIVQQARVLIQNGGGQARIQLHPPQLGELGVKLIVTEQSVQLGFTADRMPLAELLARHLPELRHALDAQGLQIDRFSVDVRQREDDGGAFRSGDQRFEREGWGASRRQPSGDFGDFSLSNGRFVRAIRVTSLGTVDVHV
jgi:flagellar hook-length control protein FliK